MVPDPKNRDIARGEAKSKIQWGAEVEEAAELLRSKYQITGAEADLIIAEAVAARRIFVRKKAAIKLGFALVGLAVSLTYFVIKQSTGIIRVGAGPSLMGALGLTCLVVGVRSAAQMVTGEATGSVH